MKNYYTICYTIYNAIKDIIKSGNYETLVLDLMNESKIIFPGHYIHMKNQAHGECDFIDDATDEKYDAKFPINQKQGQMIGSRNGNVNALATEFLKEAFEFGQCFSGNQKKSITELGIFKKMHNNISKTQEDENVIFFIPYPIVFDYEGFPLIGASDLLKKIYSELSANNDISGKRVYAIYTSIDHKMVLRNLQTNEREYIQCPELQKYVDYNIQCIKMECN